MNTITLLGGPQDGRVIEDRDDLSDAEKTVWCRSRDGHHIAYYKLDPDGRMAFRGYMSRAEFESKAREVKA